MTNQEESDYIQEEDKGNDLYSRWLWVGCYLTAGLFVILTFLAIYSGIEKGLDLLEVETSIKKIAVIASVAFTTIYFTRKLGGYWRSNKNDIGTGVITIFNVFYDPNYRKGPFALKREITQLRLRLLSKTRAIEALETQNDQLIDSTEYFQRMLQIFIRHHENSNRIIGSINYLMNNNNKEYIERLIKDTLTECITILQRDQSDKSITLFHLVDDTLKVKEYVRINSSSLFDRTFKKGEGFAGYIWRENRSEVINLISEDDPRFSNGFEPNHRFKSILGVPLTIDNTFYGVLCIQSEIEEGFHEEEDLRTVKFYAQICTMLLHYDKISIRGN